MLRKSPIFALSCLALVFAAVVVVLGSFTRLADAGLGCPDWPTCYGHLWVPNSSEEIHLANRSFQQTPVETDKTWPEQIHRIFASTLGVIILAMFFVTVKRRKPEQPWRSVVILVGALVAGVIARIFVGDSLDVFLWALVIFYFVNILRLKDYPVARTEPFFLPATLVGLVILQGFFGMWTVTLKLWPQVVTAHLLGGFATLSLIWLLLQRSGQYQWRFQAREVIALVNAQKLAIAALIAVVIQVALGGWTSSNYAALACPDFPTCQNALVPHADYGQGFNLFQKLGPNYLGGLLENEARIAIHFVHRLGAIVVTVLTLLLAAKLWRIGQTETRRMAAILGAVLATQIGLGISNIVFSLPLSVAVLHNAGGAVLLLVIITINHRIKTISTL